MNLAGGALPRRERVQQSPWDDVVAPVLVEQLVAGDPDSPSGASAGQGAFLDEALCDATDVVGARALAPAELGGDRALTHRDLTRAAGAHRQQHHEQCVLLRVERVTPPTRHVHPVLTPSSGPHELIVGSAQRAGEAPGGERRRGVDGIPEALRGLIDARLRGLVKALR